MFFFSATKPDSGTSVSLWCFYHYFPHNQIWMIWELLNSCFHKRAAFPGSSKFSHCQIETGSFSWEKQLGRWTGTPGGALTAPPAGPPEMALDSETKLFSTLRALDHVLSVQSRAHCPAGPECAQIPKVVCKCPELKGFGFFFFFFSQRSVPCTGLKIAWKLVCVRNSWDGRNPRGRGSLPWEWDFTCFWSLQLEFKTVGEKIYLSR